MRPEAMFASSPGVRALAADPLQAKRAVPPWHDVPLAEGRDLARDHLWQASLAVARARRTAAKHPLRLPRARRLSISLVVAAVAAATPALGSAHTRSSSKSKAAKATQTHKTHRHKARPNDGVLERGDRGRAVGRLQLALGLTDDRVFGPKTEKAVKAFQRASGLEADGKVGRQTKRALGGLRRPASRAGAVLLQLGDEGKAVARLQRQLKITADGIFGPGTRKAVKRFQKKSGLRADGIAGPTTRAALANRSARRQAIAQARTVDGFDPGLAAAIALAKQMDLAILSGYRPGSTINGSGGRSDHAYYPSKAVDVQGTAAEMKRYALAVAGLPGVDTIIYAGTGLWLAGRGWGAIRSSVTYSDHIGHVHVDTF